MPDNDRKIQNYAQHPHIMVVDDDRRIRELVVQYLSAQGFVVLSAGDGREARALLERFEVDALVLDVMMPGESGLELASALREGGNAIPILMLTALGEAGDRIAGLEAGVDDYLPKPFEPRELVLRLNAILRRVSPKAGGARWRIGPWVYEPEEDILRSGEDVQHLTGTEAALLKALLERAGEVLSRDELAESCGLDAGERTIDVQVTRLRRKIESESKTPRYLQTVRGKGYRLRAERTGV